jgi:hypothetical protein
MHRTLLRLSIVETDGSPRLSIEAFLLDSMNQKLAMASLHQFEGLTLPEQRAFSADHRDAARLAGKRQPLDRRHDLGRQLELITTSIAATIGHCVQSRRPLMDFA